MKRLLTLTVLGAALTATSAFGALTTYTDLTAYNTAISGGATVTENFNTNTSLFTTFTLAGSSPNGFIRTFAGGERTTQVSTNGESETISLNNLANMTGVGADFNLAPGGAGQFVLLTVNYFGGGSETVAVPSNNTTTSFFFGVTSTTEFVSFKLSAGNGSGVAESFNFDNLVIGQVGEPAPPPSDVPEPSTFGLMGLAMVGLGFIRRNRR